MCRRALAVAVVAVVLVGSGVTVVAPWLVGRAAAAKIISVHRADWQVVGVSLHPDGSRIQSRDGELFTSSATSARWLVELKSTHCTADVIYPLLHLDSNAPSWGVACDSR